MVHWFWTSVFVLAFRCFYYVRMHLLAVAACAHLVGIRELKCDFLLVPIKTKKTLCHTVTEGKKM